MSVVSSILAPRAGPDHLTAPRRGAWTELWSNFRHDRLAMAGLAMISVVGVLALSAPLVAQLVGHGPNQIFDNMIDGNGLPRGPSGKFFFGADQDGRDVFVRAVYGARTSLIVALSAAAASTVFGTAVGIAAGYFGGAVDVVLARTIDVFLSLPVLLFAISISSVASVTTAGALDGLLKPGVWLVSSIIAFFGWPYVARIVRGQTISLREREFVQAATGLGESDLRIMAHEVLPNVLSQVLVYLTLVIPGNVLFEAALSYFGLGVPESTPSWGQMIADATNNSLFTYAWWMMLFPGLFLLATMLGFNLVGDGVRDAFDQMSSSGTR